MNKAAKSRNNCYKLFSKAKASDGRYGTDPETNQELFDQLMKADPTGGANCQWLLKQYRVNQINLAETDQIREDLTLFFEYNLTLPTGEQNLEAYDYEGITRIVAKIRSGIPLVSGIYERDDVIVIVNNNRFTIAIPLSFKASQLLGAGTKWCVSSRKNFDAFILYSPFYIINFRGNKNEKYAVSFVTGDLKNISDETPSDKVYQQLTTVDPILRNFFYSNEFRIPNEFLHEYILRIDRRLSHDNDLRIVNILFSHCGLNSTTDIFDRPLSGIPYVDNMLLSYISRYYIQSFPFLEEFVNLYIIPSFNKNYDEYLSRPNDRPNDYIKDGIIVTKLSMDKDIDIIDYIKTEKYYEVPDERYIVPEDVPIRSTPIVVVGTKPSFLTPKDFSQKEISSLWNFTEISSDENLRILTKVYTFCEIELPNYILVKFIEQPPESTTLQILTDYCKIFPTETNMKILDIYSMGFSQKE